MEVDIIQRLMLNVNFWRSVSLCEDGFMVQEPNTMKIGNEKAIDKLESMNRMKNSKHADIRVTFNRDLSEKDFVKRLSVMSRMMMKDLIPITLPAPRLAEQRAFLSSLIRC